MNELAWAVLIGASSFRLWRMFALDTIFEPARSWLIRRDGLDWFGELLHCPWCIGFWYCGALSWFVTGQVLSWTFVVLWLASSTVAGMLGKLETPKE